MGSWRMREGENSERGRGSGGGPGARVAGEDRGFESGVAFRGARSALSSREPGERKRTCISVREKRVVPSRTLGASTFTKPPVAHSRQKSVKEPRITSNAGLRPFPCLFYFPRYHRNLAVPWDETATD